MFGPKNTALNGKLARTHHRPSPSAPGFWACWHHKLHVSSYQKKENEKRAVVSIPPPKQELLTWGWYFPRHSRSAPMSPQVGFGDLLPQDGSQQSSKAASVYLDIYFYRTPHRPPLRNSQLQSSIHPCSFAKSPRNAVGLPVIRLQVHTGPRLDEPHDPELLSLGHRDC